MKYTHILFDADNTLFDFDLAEHTALSQVLRDCGCTPTEQLLSAYHAINDQWWRKFERGEATMDELSTGRFEQLAQEAHITIDAQAANQKYLRGLGRCGFLLDGALELIERLHAKGCQLYIITNGNASVQHPRIDESPIRRYIRATYISMEIGFSKPAKSFFDYVLGDIGDLPLKKILVVGDSLRSDILGGVNAGLDTCWISSGGAHATGDVQPTYTVRHLDEIDAVVDGTHC